MTGLRWTYPDHFGQSRRLSQVFSGFLCLLLQVAAMKCSGHRVQRASVHGSNMAGSLARQFSMDRSMARSLVRSRCLSPSWRGRSRGALSWIDPSSTALERCHFMDPSKTVARGARPRMDPWPSTWAGVGVRGDRWAPALSSTARFFPRRSVRSGSSMRWPQRWRSTADRRPKPMQ